MLHRRNISGTKRVRLSEDFGEVGFPLGYRLAHLLLVLRPVINGRNTRDRAGDVIKEPFEDMRGDTEIGKAGCECPSEIVQRPVGNAGKPIERGLALAPAVEGRRRVSACGKEQLGLRAFGDSNNQ